MAIPVSRLVRRSDYDYERRIESLTKDLQAARAELLEMKRAIRVLIRIGADNKGEPR